LIQTLFLKLFIFEGVLDFILENLVLPNLLLFTFVSHPVMSDTLDYIV